MLLNTTQTKGLDCNIIAVKWKSECREFTTCWLTPQKKNKYPPQSFKYNLVRSLKTPVVRTFYRQHKLPGTLEKSTSIHAYHWLQRSNSYFSLKNHKRHLQSMRFQYLHKVFCWLWLLFPPPQSTAPVEITTPLKRQLPTSFKFNSTKTPPSTRHEPTWPLPTRRKNI